MRLNRSLILFILILVSIGVSGCGPGDNNKHARKELTPAEMKSNKCLDDIMVKKAKFDGNIAIKETEFYGKGNSTIALVIYARRADEEFCAAEVKCQSLKEPIRSVFFENCLNGEN